MQTVSCGRGTCARRGCCAAAVGDEVQDWQLKHVAAAALDERMPGSLHTCPCLLAGATIKLIVLPTLLGVVLFRARPVELLGGHAELVPSHAVAAASEVVVSACCRSLVLCCGMVAANYLSQLFSHRTMFCPQPVLPQHSQ